MLVYDISEQKSFDKIRDYYCDKIDELCKEDIPVILLGNKTDLNNQRKIKEEDGIELAKDNNYKFKETSCLKNENVAGAFESLIEMWNVEVNDDNKNFKNNLKINNTKKKSGGCCG